MLDKILAEVERAKTLHPRWPADIIHATAIVAEEAGEAVKAALDHTYFGKPIAEVERELIHTAATCLRALEGLR